MKKTALLGALLLALVPTSSLPAAGKCPIVPDAVACEDVKICNAITFSGGWVVIMPEGNALVRMPNGSLWVLSPQAGGDGKTYYGHAMMHDAIAVDRSQEMTIKIGKNDLTFSKPGKKDAQTAILSNVDRPLCPACLVGMWRRDKLADTLPELRKIAR